MRILCEAYLLKLKESETEIEKKDDQRGVNEANLKIRSSTALM